MAESIKDKVAIIGMGCCKFGENWWWNAEDMLVESTKEAFADAGVEPKDIQAAWLGTTGSFSGQLLARPLKLQYIPIVRVENACATATDAFRNACYAVAAGVYDMVLAAGVDKLKDSGISGLGGDALLPGGTGTATGTSAPGSFALAGTRYAHTYGMTFAELKHMLAQIDVKNHHNGSLNPKAHFQREITVEQAVNAPMIAWPLGLFDCCGVSDGSAAAIITTPEIAKKLKPKGDYILVSGLAISCGAGQGQTQNKYDFVHFQENVTAGDWAYREAGITDPFKEIDLAEVHDCFSITETIIYEDMKWAPRGGAKERIYAGAYTLEGELPVNPDGGLKCFGHPIGASGIRMIYEVWLQMLGRAGKRQLKKADIGLTHNLGGAPGSFTCAVAIFRKPD